MTYVHHPDTYTYMNQRIKCPFCKVYMEITTIEKRAPEEALNNEPHYMIKQVQNMDIITYTCPYCGAILMSPTKNVLVRE